MDNTHSTELKHKLSLEYTNDWQKAKTKTTENHSCNQIKFHIIVEIEVYNIKVWLCFITFVISIFYFAHHCTYLAGCSWWRWWWYSEYTNCFKKNLQKL